MKTRVPIGPEREKIVLNTVDLFCGCGGMSLGFQNAGFKIKYACDNWDPAISVYKSNFSHTIEKLDVSKKSAVKRIANFSPDLIVGGPPCQDFSSAGRANFASDRANLVSAFARIVAEVRPRFFVMENVPGVRHSKIYTQAEAVLRKSGYGLSKNILDACYCGVPQSRKRLFLVGGLGCEDGFLKPYIDELLSEKHMTLRDYFGDSLGMDYYFRIPTNYTRRAIFSFDEPSKTVRAVDRPIPGNYKKHPDDLVSVGKKVRAFTVLERSYIQTFPKNFKFEGTKTNLNQMIGNAVPVKMAELLANSLSNFIRTNKLKVKKA